MRNDTHLPPSGEYSLSGPETDGKKTGDSKLFKNILWSQFISIRLPAVPEIRKTRMADPLFL
jgi:hypothetical protein